MLWCDVCVSQCVSDMRLEEQILILFLKIRKYDHFNFF